MLATFAKLQFLSEDGMRREETCPFAVIAWSRRHPYGTCWILLSLYWPALMGSCLYCHAGSLVLTDDLSVTALFRIIWITMINPTKVKKPCPPVTRKAKSHAQLVMYYWVCSEKLLLLDLPALLMGPLPRYAAWGACWSGKRKNVMSNQSYPSSYLSSFSKTMRQWLSNTIQENIKCLNK